MRDHKLFVVLLTVVLLLGFWSATSYAASSKPHYATPTGLTQSIVSSDSIEVTWRTPEYSNFYVVRYSKHSDFDHSTWYRSKEVNVNSLSLDGLQPNTKYYIKVAVTNWEGDRLSSYSKVHTVRTTEVN